MMKLGTQTGSLVNHIYSGAKGSQPEIGMGATICMWSDRSAGTITDIFRKGKYTYICVTQDDAKRIDNNGMSECQEYEYTHNPDGRKFYFRSTMTDTSWEAVYMNSETGRFKKTTSYGVAVGVRKQYYDFSF